MRREIVRAVAVIAVWLVTFCILLFGDFRFDFWGGETSKNVLGMALLFAAIALSTVIILWRPRGSQGQGADQSEPKAEPPLHPTEPASSLSDGSSTPRRPGG